MRNPPRNNPPYDSPTGRHSALRFFFCPVFRAAGLFPSPPVPLRFTRRPYRHQLSRHKGLYSGGWPPDPPHHTFSPPFSFALLFPDTSPPGAPSAAFFAIAPIGCPLFAGSPDVGLCFSRRSLSSPLRTFSPPFSFAFLFPDASSPGALSAAFFAIAPIECPLSARFPDVGLCFSRWSLRTSHSPCLPGRICMHSAFPILRQFIGRALSVLCSVPAPSAPSHSHRPFCPSVSALRQPIPGRTKKQRMSKTSAVFQL